MLCLVVACATHRTKWTRVPTRWRRTPRALDDAERRRHECEDGRGDEEQIPEYNPTLSGFDSRRDENHYWDQAYESYRNPSSPSPGAVNSRLCRLAEHSAHGPVQVGCINKRSRVRARCTSKCCEQLFVVSHSQIASGRTVGRPTSRFTGPARRPWTKPDRSAARAPVQPLVRQPGIEDRLSWRHHDVEVPRAAMSTNARLSPSRATTFQPLRLYDRTPPTTARRGPRAFASPWTLAAVARDSCPLRQCYAAAVIPPRRELSHRNR
jgi:hypothetical protein